MSYRMTSARAETKTNAKAEAHTYLYSHAKSTRASYLPAVVVATSTSVGTDIRSWQHLIRVIPSKQWSHVARLCCRNVRRSSSTINEPRKPRA